MGTATKGTSWVATEQLKRSSSTIAANAATAFTFSTTFNTANKYVATDIQSNITVPDAKITYTEGALTAEASFDSTTSTYLTTTNTGYPIKIAAKATRAASSLNVTSDGWVDANDTNTSLLTTGTASDDETQYIKAGALAKPVATVSTSSTNVSLTSQSTQPTSGYYITSEGNATGGITTAGWIPATATSTADKATKYYTLPSAVLSNTASSGSEYTENTSVVLAEDGYLYISEGYLLNTKISLATLVPDDATIKGIGTDEDESPYIYQGLTVYDKDGKLITGTEGNGTLTVSSSVEGSVSAVTVTWNAEKSKFNVSSAAGGITGTATASVATRGLVTTATETITYANGTTATIAKTADVSADIEGTVSVDALLDEVGLGADKTTDGTVKPVPAISASSLTTGKYSKVTSATKGTYYLAIDTPAITASTTVTPKVTADGYGTTEHYGATPTTVTRGTSAADTLYINIAAGSVSQSLGTETVSTAVSATKGVTAASTAPSDTSSKNIVSLLPSDVSGYLVIGDTVGTKTSSYSTTVTAATTEGYVSTNASASTQTINKTWDATVSLEKVYIEVYAGSYTTSAT